MGSKSSPPTGRQPAPQAQRLALKEIKMATAKFLSKDQHWQDETTVYWFDLEGDTVGVSESGPESTIVDCDGMPMTEGDGATIKARRACIVTEEMRAA